MITRFRIIILFISVAFCQVTVAQDIIQDEGTTRVYKKIEEFSSRRKLTSTIHHLLLKPLNHVPPSSQIQHKPVLSETYENFEGKIIRKIHITTLDPFGYSLKDTSAKPIDFISKGGNSLHIKTQELTIRNRLLFKNNEHFDSLAVRESERLIRSQSYIKDVLIQAIEVGTNCDSVDVYIRALDLWSIIPDGAVSSSRFTIELSDKNLGGLGHTFNNRFTQNYLNGDNAYSGYYFIPNIKSTYISSQLRYIIDEDRNFLKSLNIERPFFSPLTRWAGGIFASQEMSPIWLFKNDTTRLYLHSKFNIQDYWVASAWQLVKGHSETDRVTKLILSGRLYNIRFLQKPVEQPELNDYFTSERFYMGSIGISKRNFVKQTYIFKYGITEDISLGQVFGFVGGYQIKNQERWYWGVRHSWGNIYKWGFLSTNIEYGTFINSARHSQGMLTASIHYFSPLLHIGKWKFRQFARPEITLGFNRPVYDRLTLNDGYGLNGFNSSTLSGTSRLLIVIQTQSYAPWNVAGFRFGPYLNFAFGMLGNETSGFSHSRMYPQLGFGVLIQNEFLTTTNLQISFAFYPTIPGTGENIIKINPVRTTDFTLPDFILGKPETVLFR